MCYGAYDWIFSRKRYLAGWKGFEPLADGLRVHRSACLSYQPVLKLSHNYIIMIYTFRRLCMKHCYTQ